MSKFCMCNTFNELLRELQITENTNRYCVSNKHVIKEMVNIASSLNHYLFRQVKLMDFTTPVPNCSIVWNDIDINEDGVYVLIHHNQTTSVQCTFSLHDITSYKDDIQELKDMVSTRMSSILETYIPLLQYDGYEVDNLNGTANEILHLCTKKINSMLGKYGSRISTTIVYGADLAKIAKGNDVKDIIERTLKWPIVINVDTDHSYAMIYENTGIMFSGGYEGEVFDHTKALQDADDTEIIEFQDGLLISNLRYVGDFKRIKLLYYGTPMVFVVTEDFIKGNWIRDLTQLETVA